MSGRGRRDGRWAVRIVVACDSFKGSLSAPDACAIVAAALREGLPEAAVMACPMADGGEGTAETLVRAGVGFIRLVDRDFVEITNLQRQVLFDEQDLASQLPKAVAATRKLNLINGVGWTGLLPIPESGVGDKDVPAFYGLRVKFDRFPADILHNRSVKPDQWRQVVVESLLEQVGFMGVCQRVFFPVSVH